MYEIGSRIGKISTNKDFASTLKLSELKQLMTEDKYEHLTPNEILTKYQNEILEEDNKVFNLEEFKKLIPNNANEQKSNVQLSKALRDHMGIFRAEMGLEAGLKAFSLFLDLLKSEQDTTRKALIVKIDSLQKEITSWNRIQGVRFAQQILFCISFLVVFLILGFPSAGNILKTTDDLTMSAANILPLGMDTCCPYKRNTPAVVKGVTDEDIIREIYKKI